VTARWSALGEFSCLRRCIFPFKSEDYDAFLVLLKTDLPASYWEWLVWRTNRINHCSPQFRVLDIEVKPDDYVAFCAAERRTYTRSLKGRLSSRFPKSAAI
jgi:hypothetical protein